MSKRWRVTIIFSIFSIFAIAITAWQAANWYRTTRAIQEIQERYALPAKMAPPVDEPMPEPITPVSAPLESGGEFDIKDSTSHTVVSQEQEIDMPEREDLLVEEESESKVQEGVLEKEGLPAEHEKFLAEHEKFLAEHSAAVMLHIPHIVDYLNSLSADEQHAFFKQAKATLRAVALEHGETNLEILDKSVELFVNQLLEAGFEPRY